jgi:hypothetical protein
LFVNYRGEVIHAFVENGGNCVDAYKVGHRPHWATCPGAAKSKAAQALAEKDKLQAIKIRQDFEKRKAKQLEKEEKRKIERMQLCFW